MNPLTAILQASHSALIDELCERHPEPKPVLGMPTRFAHWLAPHGGLQRAYTAFFELGKEVSLEGILTLAATNGVSAALNLSVEKLASNWLMRCGSEFHRLNVSPALRPFSWEDFTTPPRNPELVRVTRLIWMPIQLGAETVYMGIAARAPR